MLHGEGVSKLEMGRSFLKKRGIPCADCCGLLQVDQDHETVCCELLMRFKGQHNVQIEKVADCQKYKVTQRRLQSQQSARALATQEEQERLAAFRR